MKIISKIKSSICDPAYYKELNEKTIGYSFKYFFSLIFLLSLLSTIIFSVIYVPKAKSFLDSLGPKMISYYPAELEIKIKNGVATSNVTEPYMIKIPDELKKTPTSGNDSSNYENLLVVDTTHDL